MSQHEGEHDAGGAQDALPPLSSEERIRYDRHLILPEFGEEGQRRLKGARVLCIGAGGLGSPIALYLAAAGVGTLGIVDFDVVDVSNLQRQILHGTSDVGRSKLDSAAERLQDLNPHVEIVRHSARLTSDNAMEILSGYDLVVDGSDNFPTRYLVNDACILTGIPFVYGAIHRFEGQVAVFAHPTGPCYRCLFREPPPPGMVPSCAEAGVLGVLPGIIGSIQALEAIKLLIGREDAVGKLLIFEGMESRTRTIEVRKAPDCPACGEAPTVTELIDYERFCGLRGGAEISPSELARRLDAGETLTLIDVREPHEWEIANLSDRGAQLIPLAEVGERLDELRAAPSPLVLMCKSGGRSAKAVALAEAAGIEGVLNLTGGILGWQAAVDPSLERY